MSIASNLSSFGCTFNYLRKRINNKIVTNHRKTRDHEIIHVYMYPILNSNTCEENILDLRVNDKVVFTVLFYISVIFQNNY